MDSYNLGDTVSFSHFNATLRSSTALLTPQFDRNLRRPLESIAASSALTNSTKLKGLPSLLKAQQKEQARTDTEEYDCSALYGKFIESLRLYAEPSQTLELLNAFISAVNEEIAALRCGAISLRNAAERQRVHALLQRERQSWMLLHALLADRIRTELRKHEAATQMELGSDEERSLGDADSIVQRSAFGSEIERREAEPRSVATLNRASEKSIWERFVAADSELREALIIITLLETFANEQLSDATTAGSDGSLPFIDSTFSCLPLDRTRIGWQATLRTLETHRETAAMRSGVFTSRDEDATKNANLSFGPAQKGSTTLNLVTELDCDAPIRERAMLADADREDDMRLVRALFTYVRAGRLDDAAELCRRCGQPWRAATFQHGFRLFHDANHLQSQSQSRSGRGCEMDTSWHGGNDGSDRLEADPLFLLGEADGLREGNERRRTWKALTARLVRDARVPVFERALYAALIGDADGMLAACSSFYDALWALLRAYVIEKRDADLTSKFVALDRLVSDNDAAQRERERERDAVADGVTRTTMTLRGVFDALEASANRTIRAEAGEPYSNVLKWIVLDNERNLVDTLFRAVSKSSAPKVAPSKLTVRFFAHLLIVLRRIVAAGDADESEEPVDDSCDEMLDARSVSVAERRSKTSVIPYSRAAFESKCSAILEAYVNQLVRDQQFALVAFYAKQLPTADDSVLCYARFLDGLADRTTQQECLVIAERDGLDVQAIARAVVELVTTRTDTNPTRPAMPSVDAQLTRADSPVASDRDRPDAHEDDWLVAALTDADRARIAAIDWLVYAPDQRAEAIRQANTLCRSFLLVDKLSGAIETLARLPSDSIDTAIRQFQARADVGAPLSAELDCTIREHLAVRLYLEAHGAYQNWFYVYQNRPRFDDENLNRYDSQSSLTDARNFELATRLETDRRRKQYEADVSKWNETVRARSFETVQKLYNVVLFAGGWMIDETNADDQLPDAIDRRRTLATIRRRCLPKLALSALRVLEAARRDEETLSFVEVLLGEENGCLFELFDEADLRRVSEFARRASTRLITEQQLDAFGYPPAFSVPKWTLQCTQFV